MPKTEIDYSTTIIYKITCKDILCQDVYIGHTTNFVQRKHSHKQGCVNEKSNNYNCKLYKIIRENGGWNNWKMEIINWYNCKNSYEARKKEQEYFELFNATLNSVEPMAKPKLFLEKKIKTKQLTNCNLYNDDIKQNIIEIHPITTTNSSNKHINKFECIKCEFKCYKKYAYNRHLATDKHKLKHPETKNETTPTFKTYHCICGEKMNSRTTFWRHKKKCIFLIKNPIDKKGKKIIENNKEQSEIICKLIQQNTELINQNKEFKELIIEQTKTITALAS